MLRLLADENLNGHIVRGLLRRRPELDIVRVQDVGLIEMEDPAILEWAAQKNRVLVTHDQATVPYYAYERLTNGYPLAGVFVLSKQVSVRNAIDELLLLDELTEQVEWANQVAYLPL